MNDDTVRDLLREDAAGVPVIEPDWHGVGRRIRRHRRRRVAVAAVAGLAVVALVVALPGVTERLREPDVAINETPTVPASPRHPSEGSTEATPNDPSEANGVGWETFATDVGPGRTDHVAVWSGSEMIVWGGLNEEGELAGLRFDPTTEVWRHTARAPLEPRRDAAAVWTGREMLVLGGVSVESSTDGVSTHVHGDGALYDPATDTWRAVPPMPIEPRQDPVVVWTGEELFVWGGHLGPTSGETGLELEVFGDGATFDPETATWTVLPAAPVAARGGHVGVWTGDRVLVWGGGAVAPEAEGFATETFVDGATYDPAERSWAAIDDAPTTTPGLEFADDHAAVWTGTQLVVWFGRSVTPSGDDGAPYGVVYDVARRAWMALPRPPLDERRAMYTSVWTGNEMIVWGGLIGEGGNHPWDNGAAYEPASGTWRQLSSSPMRARSGHTAVWTGGEMLVWGGSAVSEPGAVGTDAADGASYTPPGDDYCEIAREGGEFFGAYPDGIDPRDLRTYFDGTYPYVLRLADTAPSELHDEWDPMFADFQEYVTALESVDYDVTAWTGGTVPGQVFGPATRDAGRAIADNHTDRCDAPGYEFPFFADIE